MNTPTRILVVDDDPQVCRFLDRFLSGEGYQVLTAGSGAAMRRVIGETGVDLIVLDLMLPGEDGLSLARKIRAESDIPVIILTGKQDTVDKVVGLEMGADDYVTKPFDRRELLARIRSLLRRSHAKPAPIEAPSIERRVAKFAGWQLDLIGRELISASGERVHLTTHEFDLLAMFAERPRRAITREQVLDLIADRHWDPMDRSIDVMVGKLRRKLGDDPRNPDLIKTLRGVGYMFVTAVEYE